MAEIKSIMIGLLIFSGVVTGMSLFYGDLTDDSKLQSYGYTQDQIDSINPEDIQSKNRINDVNQRIESMRDAMRDNPLKGVPILEQVALFAIPALQAITIPLEMVCVIENMIEESFSFLNIPPFFTDIILASITITIIFAIISAFIKWRM